MLYVHSQTGYSDSMTLLTSDRLSSMSCLHFLMTASSSYHHFWIKGESVPLHPLFLPFHSGSQRVALRMAEEICVQELD